MNHPERVKLEGLLTYAHGKHGARWDIELSTDDWAATDRDIDGIIAYVMTPADRARFAATGLPAVLIEDELQPTSAARAKNAVTLLFDNESIGRTAAEYFLSRHFTSFAFYGCDDREWCRARERGFRDRLAQEGLDAATDADITQLPHPCAVFCAHDKRARQLLAATAKAGIKVPQELAILGVDDDEMLCTTVSPALSSIPTGDFRLGYYAGRILEELLSGRAKGGRLIRVTRSRVVSRPSTDADAVTDPFVARVLVYARTHLDAKLDIVTLARRIGYSVRMLQLRTERALGHPISEEIRRIRLEAALELLRETDMPIAEVADSCGFTSASHLDTRIRESTGFTPLQLRRRHAAIKT